MTDMVERVARAIQKADFEDSGLPWDSINPEGQSDYRKYASAAIEVVLEPTAEMIERVARASFAFWKEQNSRVAEFEDMNPDELEFAMAHARVMINAYAEFGIRNESET